MRAWQVFADMTPERMNELLAALAQRAPGTHAQALAAAGAAMKARPVYLLRMPPEKRAQAVRRALARVRGGELAEEVLASYFLDCRRELLIEWLDALGLEHENGVLQDDPPPPPAEKLREAVERFRAGEGSADRELLMSAFAAQSAIDWPELEAVLGVSSAA